MIDWGLILKDVAPVVAIIIVFYWVLKAILVFVSATTGGESLEIRKTLAALAAAIEHLTQYLRTSNNGQQLRADRNMLFNMDRFDDLEYLLEGLLPEKERDRWAVLNERRKQRELKHAKFLTMPNEMQHETQSPSSENNTPLPE